MGDIKKVLFKLALLLVVLIGLNYIYAYTYYEIDLDTHAKFINLVRNVVDQKAEIVYVGESSNITTRETDVDKRAISDFIAAYFPSLKVGAITKQACHAGIYYHLLNNIPKESSVKTVVVTLNLRSFDANWIYSNLETPLQKSVVLIRPYPPLLNRLMLSFKNYEIKTDQERESQFKQAWKTDLLKFPGKFPYHNVHDWDSAQAYNGIKNADGSINYPNTELACHYIKTYAFQIDTLNNPRIHDFDQIVELANRRNWKLVFNLMAENVEKASELVGSELIYLMQKNRELLKKRYEKKGVIVVDNFDLVPDTEYIDRNWTTEHYAEKGRKIIAKNVANTLKTIYPKDYVDVDFSNQKQVDFYNACEGSPTWGQMQTLNVHRSFSGEKSSQIGGDQPYSITFEYPINNLPVDLKFVDISFQLYQENTNHDAQLMIDISGKNINYKLDGTLITKLVNSAQKWEPVHYIYHLPPNFSQGDLIKIYVFNPSKTVMNIDDIKLRFY